MKIKENSAKILIRDKKPLSFPWKDSIHDSSVSSSTSFLLFIFSRNGTDNIIDDDDDET